MKKLVLAAACFAAIAGKAQNVQLHYDLGRNLYSDVTRPKVTATYEMFKPDRWGQTFLFVDMDFYNSGMASAYTEISHEWNLPKTGGFAAHIEYNGGLSSNRLNTYTSRFQHKILTGAAWNWNNSDFSSTLSFQALYTYSFKNSVSGDRPASGFQGTTVWNRNFAKGLLSFSGYLDVWYDHTVKGKWAWCTEPQLWLNLNAIKSLKNTNLSLGTEWEISDNFVYNDEGNNNKVRFMPTVALKWTWD